MVAFVTGSTLGLSNSSLAGIGSNGLFGDPQAGRAGEQIFVNAATGDLVIQRQDEFVTGMGLGPGTSVVRTYNSLGKLTDDNGDNWQLSVVKTLSGYVAGSSITRNDGDGASLAYTWDAGRHQYVCKTGAGAFDTLQLAGSVWTWTDGDTGATETYDATSLKMLTSSDREGNTAYYAYTGNLLASVTDAAGEVTTFTYAGNNLASITTTHADGSTASRVSYAYDANNNLASVVAKTSDGKTCTTSYAYNTRGQLVSITQADGSKLAFTYDSTSQASGRITRIVQTMADGVTTATTQIQYNAGKTTITDPLLKATVLAYDNSRRLTGITYPVPVTGGVAPKVSFTYNGATSELASQTDGLNNVIEYFYDAMGRQVEQHSGSTAANGTGSTILREFDNASGVLTSESVFVTPDPDGNAVTGTEKNGLTTTYVYDPAKVHVHYVVSPQGRVTEFRYDSYGRQTGQIEFGDRLYTGALDEASITSWAAQPQADRTKWILTQTAYLSRAAYGADLVKDVTRFGAVDAQGNGVASTASVTEYIYSPSGQLLCTTDPDGDSTAYSYDGLGRVLTRSDASGQLTTYVYDDARNTTAVTYANGLTTTTTYDAAGRPISVANSGTALGTTTFWYDADGRLRMTQDATRVKSYSLYDDDDRKVADIDANGTLTEYVYDAGNRVVETITYATNLNAAKLATLVDAGGNPANVALSSVRPAVTANDRKTWNFYDDDGRLTTQVDERGYVTDTFYDGASRVTRTIRWATPTTTFIGATTTRAAISVLANALDQATQYFYDKDGQLTVTIAPDGLVTQNEYDAAGNLRHTVAYANGGATATDPATSLLVPVLPPADNAKDSHAWYFYDGQQRLTATVDADGNLTEHDYDASGNKVADVLHTRTGIVASSITTATSLFSLYPLAVGCTQITQYTYTGLNQLKTRKDADGIVTQYTYDATGNLTRTDRAPGTSDARTMQVKVDGFGRVTNELSAAGSAALAALGPNPAQSAVNQIWQQYQTTSTYDSAGRKTAMVDANGLRTLYYYDNDGQLACTINAAGEVTQNVYSGLEQLQQVIHYGTRLTTAQLATLSGGVLDAAATATLNIANASVDSSVSYTYANGNLVAQKDANGNYTRYLYGAGNRLLYELDAANHLTAYTYDVAGRLVNTTTFATAVQSASIAPNAATPLTAAMFSGTWLAGLAQPALDESTTTVYDSLGRAAFVVSGAGSVVARTYDANGNIACEARYATAIALPASLTLASVQAALRPDAAHDRVAYRGYDTAGHLTYLAESSGAGLYTVTTSQYDASGHLIAQRTYANRIATPVSATGAHTMPAADDAHDAQRRWVYDSAGHVTASAVAQRLDGANLMWAVSANTYDPDGNLASTTDFATLLSSLGLAAEATQATVAGWMARAAHDPGHDRSTAMQYDKTGRLLAAADAAGTTTTYQYDAAGRVAISTAQGLATRTVYDAQGRPVYGIGTLGDVTMNTYDAAGNVIAVRRYANPLNATALATLTASSTVADVQKLITLDNTNDRIERRVYDANGRLVYDIDGVGDATKYGYDGAGRVVATTQLAQRVNLASLPAAPTVANMDALATLDAANDRVEKRIYDADGRVRYLLDGGNASTGAAWFVTETSYDALGHVAATTQYAGGIAFSTAATAGAVAQALAALPHQNDRKTAYAYDSSGLLQSTQDARGNTESYAYDALGHKTSSTNKAGAVWTYTFDAAGHMLTQTDPAVAVSRAVIDASGLNQFTTDAAVQLVTQLAYNTFGELTSRTEAANVANQSRTTTYAYDAMGRQVQVLYPQAEVYGRGYGSPSSTVTYDARGNAVHGTDVGGGESSKLYDADGQVIYEIDAEGYVTGYQRNAFGQVKAMTRYAQPMKNIAPGTTPTLQQVQGFLAGVDHSTDRTITTQYDAAGRVVKVTQPQVTVYDPAHALSNNSSTFTAGQATSTVYNAFGEAIKVSVAGENASGVAVTVSADTFYTYDLRGQQLAQVSIADRKPGATSGTGYLTTTAYDAFGDVVNRVEYAAAQSWADSQFNAKTGMAIALPQQDANRRETTWAYDADGNKLAETRKGIEFSTTSDGTSAVGDASTTFAYDALGNVIATTDAAGTTTYTYRDAVGRVTAVATVPLKLKQEQIALVYVAMLGRAPDATGLAFYVSASMADIGRAVWGSAEAAPVRALPDAAFITQLYQNLLGRSPDSGGMSTWTARLQTLRGSMSEDAAHSQLLMQFITGVRDGAGQDAIVMNDVVAAALAGQPIAAAAQLALKRVQVAQLYVAILGRAPDPSGLNAYLQSPVIDAAVAQSFFNSAEAQAMYPTVATSANAQELATRLYQNVFGHAPDANALAYWTNRVPADRTTGMGSYIMEMIGSLTNGSGGNDLTAFSNKVAAGLPDAVDANATPSSLSEFLLDAYGNTVQRVDYANGADFAVLQGTSAGGSPYGRTASAGDRHTYTQYDRSGHATTTLDANGKVAFSAYDAFGHDVSDWRSVTNASGAVQTANELRTYDKLGHLIKVGDPGAVHDIVYNAFGEIVQQSLNGDVYEKNDYDNAGRLWRTNAGDGVLKVSLHDVMGRQTVQVSSAGAAYGGADLSALDIRTAGSVISLSGRLIRTDFTNDLQGHVIKQVDPTQYAWDIGTVPAAAQMTSMGSASVGVPAITAVAQPREVPMGNTEGGVESGWEWNGDMTDPTNVNTVQLSWGSLAGLGAGDVRVAITATLNTDANPGSSQPTTTTLTQDYMADQALAGVSFSFAGVGALQSVSRVQVYKKDINGNWLLVIDRGAWGDYGTFVQVDAPADGSALAFRYAPSGTTSWTQAQLIGQFGDSLLYSLPTQNEGGYDYQVNGAAGTLEAGTYATLNNALRTQIAQLYAAILQRSVDLGGLQTYLQQLQSGATTLAGVAQALYNAAGTNGELALPVNGQQMVQQFVVNALGFTGGNWATNGELNTVYLPRWLAQLQARTISNWGTALASMVSDVANYAGADADMLAARNMLANKAIVGLDYAVNDGGYTASEARGEMAALNSGKSVADAEAIGKAALNRRWVARLYVALLNRGPEAGGLASYANALNASSLAAVATDIYNSAECKAGGLLWNTDGTALSDAQFITQVYKTAAGRTASAHDIAWWTDRLAQASRGQVVVEMLDGLANYSGPDSAMYTARQIFNNKVAVGLTYAWDLGGSSADTERALMNGSTTATTALGYAQSVVTNLQTTWTAGQAGVAPTNIAAGAYPVEQTRRAVAQLYVAILNRTPDASGFASWVDNVQNGATLEYAAQRMYEQEGQIGIFAGTSDTQFVTTLYQNAFGVGPTPDQLTMWLAELGTQHLNRGTVAVHIIQSVVNMEDANSLNTRNYFAAKVGVGLTFALDMAGGDNDGATCKALVDRAHVTLTGDTTAAMALAVTRITKLASDAAAAAGATAAITQTATSKASTVSSLADATAKYAAAKAADASTPSTAQSILFTQIAQLYLAGLNRPPTGVQYTELDFYFRAMSGGADMGMVANDAFVNSPEGQTVYPKTMSDQDFVKKVYTVVLGRAADAGGLSFWTSQLTTSGGTLNRGQVLVGIMNGFLNYSGSDLNENSLRALFQNKIYTLLHTDSVAATAAGYAYASSLNTAQAKALQDTLLDNTTVILVQAQARDAAQPTTTAATQYTQIQQLIRGALFRPGTLAEENADYGLLTTGGYTMNTLADALLASADGQAQYGGLNNTAFVNQVYQTAWGRAPTASESNTWTRNLVTQSRGQVLWSIVQGLANYSGADPAELQHKADFLARVWIGVNQVNLDAQAATTGSYASWVSAATAAAQQKASSYAAEASANSALNASADAKNRRQIVQLYTLLLNHAPDSASLNSYAQQMAGGTTAAQVITAILATPEAQAIYTVGQSDTQFFSALYRTTFGRAPDAAETTLWTNALKNTTRAQGVVNLANAISSYAGADPNGGAIAAQNILNDKTQVNLADAQRDMSAWVNWLGAVYKDALPVLNPPKDAQGNAHPAPLDVMRSFGYLTSNNLAATVQGQTPQIVRTYDRWGNLVSQTDPRTSAWTTTWTYNANNEVKDTQDALGNHSLAYYDVLGRQVATRDANGNVNGQKYDAFGNVVEELHADGGTVQTTFDAFGDKLTVRNAAGETTGFSYDALGRITSMTRALGVGVYDYTVSNDASTGNDNLNAGVLQTPTERYTYDELGRLIVKVDAQGNAIHNYYDLRGNLQATDASGTNVYDTWDAYNRKTGETVGYGSADARTESWTYDAWGHVLTHTDSAHGNLGAVHTYTYDSLNKQLLRQTSTSGQNLAYTYDASSGLLVKIDDKSIAGQDYITQYAYDVAGNHVREKTSTVNAYGVEIDVAQDNHITYDALNRETQVSDSRYVIGYDYDKNGNRIHQHTHYWTDLQAGQATSDAPAANLLTDSDTYSVFDAMNRATILDGLKVNGQITIGWDDQHNQAQGVQIGYNAAGERTWMRTQGIQLLTGTRGTYTEAYEYDAAGRLTDTWREGWHVDARYYDAHGRIVQTGAVGLGSFSTERLAAAGISSDTRTNLYAGASNVLHHQTTRDRSNNVTAQLVYEYDDSQRLTRYILRVTAGMAYANGYYYSYENDNENNVARIEAYRLKAGNVPDFGDVQADTRNVYDGNGYLTNVSTNNGDHSSSTRNLVNDIAGRILTKTETVNQPLNVVFGAVPSGTHVTHTLIANGQEIGSSSDADSPDNATFAQSYVPVSDRSMTDGPSAYTVQWGDTLQSIARRVWGDANLWYVIAEANGFNSILPGQIITIPNRPSVQFNDFATFRPYDASGIVGDTTPTLPVPRPKSHDSFWGDVLAIVVAVAVVAMLQPEILAAIGPQTLYTAASIEGATVTVTATTTGLSMASAEVLSYAAAAAVGSMASQGVENAAGNQSGLSWKQVGLSAISAGVTSGLGDFDLVGSGSLSSSGNLIARAAMANAVTQGIGVATGLQKSFSWQAVAASAVGAGVGQAVAQPCAQAFGNTAAGQLGTRFATGLTAGAAAAVARGGRVAVQQVAADAFGNALGESLAYSSSSAGAPAQNTPFPDQLRPGAELPDMADIAALNAQIAAGEAPDEYPGVQVAQAKYRAPGAGSDQPDVWLYKDVYHSFKYDTDYKTDMNRVEIVGQRLRPAGVEGGLQGIADLAAAYRASGMTGATGDVEVTMEEADSALQARHAAIIANSPNVTQWDGITRDAPIADYLKRSLGGLDPVRGNDLTYQVAQQLPDAAANEVGGLAVGKFIGSVFNWARPVTPSVMYGERVTARTFGPSQLTQYRSVDTTLLTTAQKGALGEARGALTYQRAGYQQLPSKLASNNGFDGVFVKYGPGGSPIDIIINESKFSSTGRASLAKTNMGKQMSPSWINENIQKMMNSTDPAVMETGYFLDANRAMIRTKANVLDPLGNNRWNVLQLPR